MLSPRKYNPTPKNIFKQVRRHSLGMFGFFLLTIASWLIATDIDAATGINQQISFQGKVVNANGTNVTNGSYTFVFSLYTVASGGSNIWTESKSVTVTDGIFQTNLGDTTALPGSVDFNTDNIYLGVNFNADGEMSPRVRFTAAPYAFNAKKVGGLTVTDTTGTLTIPNSEVISFGGSFSTTASNDIALTTSGATTLTLPTTGTLATLAGTEVFTNKSIGSTGLTFSGATTDITTASGESLVMVANGAGVVDIQDATTVDSLTVDTGGVSIAAGQSYTGAGAVTVSSLTTNALTLDSGTTGAVNLGTGNNAKTISVGTGTAGNTINIGTDNSVSDTISIGSALDNVVITGDQWSMTDAGALTLAGVLTANGGVTLAASQIFAASSLSYMDLGAITHGTTAVQGLRLPQAASASPSSPSSGEGYLAWDAGGNQVIYYNGSAWATFGASGGYATIKDESTGLAQRTTLAFLGAGVSCADNVTQTECTISGGSGSDLQGTYDADADGSNTTISLTAADDGLVFTNPTSAGTDSVFLLQLTQQNATAAVTVLDMVQSSNAANGVSLTANSIDTETGLVITTNGLTSGKGISITSSATAFTGNLADVSLTGSNASNTGNVFALSNTGTANANTTLFVDHRATGSGNLALRVNDESGDTTPLIVDGNGRVGIGTTTVNTASNAKLALQVGSGANRSDAQIFGDITAEGYSIQRSLSGIIDLFVYDTSRDSDGGEWRNSMLSRELSWYTETKDDGIGDNCVIATDDRCGQSAFPRKAILATTADSLYIFDGSDHTLWMKFTQAGTYALGADTNNNPSGVGAQNGVIIVGTNGSSATGMYAFDFKQDAMYRYNATNRTQADIAIGNRNSAATYATDANTNLAIINATVNDVSIAMQTASNEGSAGTLIAPVDSQAGPVRGVTLIAAATDSGVSVVHMGPREVFNYSDVANDDYNQVVVTSRGRLYATNETQAQLEEWKNIDKDAASEAGGTPDRVYDETIGKSPITTGTAPTISTSPDALEVIERGSSAREAAAAGQIDSGDIVFVGTNQGLAEIHTSGGTLVAASWSKLTTTTVATPYMNGAVRSAFLFDETVGATAATSAVGSGATNNVMDTAGATSPTFGGGGVRGNSVNFGNNSYLCSDANSDGTCDADTEYNQAATSFSINMWFKHGTTAALDTLFERCWTPATPTATACTWGGMTASGAIAFGIDDDATWTVGSSMDDMITSSALYNDNQWHHAVFTNTDSDICLYIDGRQAVACDTSFTATATLDASQVVTIGGTCSGANCTTGTNLWDGSIDDFTWNSNAGTTAGGLTAQSANKLYLDGRAHLIRPATTVTDATTFSSTTIGDSGETYTPGAFVGLVVELTGGTGSGQTRMIISNTATTFTVAPAFSTTPDATTDYRVSPAKLYGSTNNVTSIGADLPTALNRVRKVYVGTSDGSDGGGVSVFTNAGAGSIKTEIIHSDAGYANDDLGSSWSGTDADDISAIATYSDTLTFGNGSFLRAQRKDISLKQLQVETIGALEDVRQQLVASGLFGATQDVLGLGQGADLAERYYSAESLEAGEVVSIDAAREAGIKRSTAAYQRDVLGIVATKPGIVLGPGGEDSYPVALVGRVPVRVTNENGQIYAGDRLTASSRPGYAMFARQAGRVIGEALSDASDWSMCPGQTDADTKPLLCTTVLVFVNLSDYYGQPIELAMAERSTVAGAAALEIVAGDETVALAGDNTSVRLATAIPTREEKLLAFLREIRDERVEKQAASSEIFTDRVAASTEVVTPRLIADEIWVKTIKADSIDGLTIYTNRIASLEAKYAGLDASAEANLASGDIEMTKEKTLLNLEAFSVGSIDVALDATILGRLSVTGALRVIDAAEFQGKTTFASLVSFLADTVFQGKVTFETAPTFGADTAGFATIEKGRKKVRVTFARAYEKQPIVTVAMTRDRSVLLDDNADADLVADVAAVEKDFAETFFDAGVQYLVTERDRTGFTILLSKDAPINLSFSWVAIAAEGAKTFESGKAEEVKLEEPIETTAIPLPIVEPDEETPPVEAPPAATEPVKATESPIPVTT